jgi:hypothetical protein
VKRVCAPSSLVRERDKEREGGREREREREREKAESACVLQEFLIQSVSMHDYYIILEIINIRE